MEEGRFPRQRAGALLLASSPHLLFLALLAASWRRWVVPFQDHGRELETPWRLAKGELLYRDVGWYFGPLPPYLDAAFLRLFGFHADVLVAARTLAALLGVEALRRLGLRLGAGPAGAAVVAACVVSLCAFGATGAWPFPYSAAALYGSVALWWALELALGSSSPARTALAALLAGLAAGAKLELAPAAVLSLLGALWGFRPRREALLGTALAAAVGGAAWVLPALLLGSGVLLDHGYLVALRTPAAWKLGQDALRLGGYPAARLFPDGLVDLLVPSLPLLAAALLLALAPLPRGVAVPALALLGAASAAWPRRQALHVLLPAAWALFGAAALLRLGLPGPGRRGRGAGADGSEAGREAGRRWAGVALALGLAMAPLLARQPLFLRFEGYLAFTAPLALVLVLATATRLPRREGVLAFLAAVALAHGLVAGLAWRRPAVAPVVTPTIRLLQPEAEARFLNEAFSALAAKTPPGSSVFVSPEPGLLLVGSGRRNPFVDTQFYPGCQTPRTEARMAATLREAPPAAVLEVDRVTAEFGAATPRHGLLDEVFVEVDRRYRPAVGLGSGAQPGGLGGRHASRGVLLLPREGRPGGLP